MKLYRRHVIVAVAAVGLVVAACGQKSGVHSLTASGGLSRNAEGQLVNPEGDVINPETGQPVSAGGGAAAGSAAAGGTVSGSGAAAGGGGGGGGAGDTTGVTNDTITIGIHAPLTGATGTPLPSSAFQNGKDVYFEWIKNHGQTINGRNVKAVFEDDGYNPGQARAACKKMVEQEHVFLLIGGAGTDQIVECAKYAASVGVPYLSEGVTEAGLSSLGNYFALTMSYKGQGPLLAQYIKNVLGPKLQKPSPKIQMLRANTPNFDDAESGFRAGAAALGLTVLPTVIVDKYNPDTQSAAGQLCPPDPTKRPDIVYPLLAPKSFVPLTAQVTSQGCANMQYAGVGITEGVNVVGDATCGSGTTSGEYFSPFPGVNTEDQVDHDFRPAWRAKTGKDPGADEDDLGWSLWGTTKLVAQMLAAPGRNLTRQTFLAAVAGKRFHSGVYPDVDYSRSRFGGTAVHQLHLDCGKTPEPYFSNYPGDLFRSSY